MIHCQLPVDKRMPQALGEMFFSLKLIKYSMGTERITAFLSMQTKSPIVHTEKNESLSMEAPEITTQMDTFDSGLIRHRDSFIELGAQCSRCGTLRAFDGASRVSARRC